MNGKVSPVEIFFQCDWMWTIGWMWFSAVSWFRLGISLISWQFWIRFWFRIWATAADLGLELFCHLQHHKLDLETQILETFAASFDQLKDETFFWDGHVTLRHLIIFLHPNISLKRHQTRLPNPPYPPFVSLPSWIWLVDVNGAYWLCCCGTFI